MYSLYQVDTYCGGSNLTYKFHYPQVICWQQRSFYRGQISPPHRDCQSETKSETTTHFIKWLAAETFFPVQLGFLGLGCSWSKIFIFKKRFTSMMTNIGSLNDKMLQHSDRKGTVTWQNGSLHCTIWWPKHKNHQL